MKQHRTRVPLDDEHAGERHNLMNRSFKPLLETAGLPQSTRFHDLRHTAASLLFSQGTHPKLVQEALGHSTIAVTLDVYSHMMPGMGNQVVVTVLTARFIVGDPPSGTRHARRSPERLGR